jgi:hypothetical protein
VLVLSVAVGYYVTFKTYHAAMVKQEQLSKLLTNPNARVASGEEGSELLAKIKEMDATKAVKKVQPTDALTEQLQHVESLIQAKMELKAIKPV